MAKGRSNGGKTALKVLMGIIITAVVLFILYLLVVVFGALLPAADPNLTAIQAYIDWAHDAFSFLVANVVGFTLFGGVLGGAGVVTYLAYKQA